MYWIVNNYEKDNWRAYRDLYVAIPFDFPQDFINKYVVSGRRWDPETDTKGNPNVDMEFAKNNGNLTD